MYAIMYVVVLFLGVLSTTLLLLVMYRVGVGVSGNVHVNSIASQPNALSTLWFAGVFCDQLYSSISILEDAVSFFDGLARQEANPSWLL